MHVGLTNFGSTCYMNSMLQILNSIDVFRNSILMADVEIPLVR
jgi:ubiquitin C-terminal hydrolase